MSTKAPRAYQSVLRREQAEATRTRILQAAATLFAADGYARTTLAAIGAAAGVSAETVQGQGPKAALLIAAMDYAAVGVVGEDDVLNLDIGRALVAIEDPAQALDALVAGVVDLNGRIAGLYLALTSGANSEPKLREYLGELFGSITAQAHRIFGVYRERGWLCDDVALDEIAETVAVLTSVETYLHITERDGRSVDHYRRWLRRMMLSTIFAVPQGN
jgi:AcrR family transcriptional regulator